MSTATNSASHSEFDDSEGAWQGCEINDNPRSDIGVIAYRIGVGAPSEEGRVRADPAVLVASAPAGSIFSEFVTGPAKFSNTNGYCVQGLLPASDGTQWYVAFSGYGMSTQQTLDETNRIVSTLRL